MRFWGLTERLRGSSSVIRRGGSSIGFAPRFTGCTPAERTVRQYVERRKRELGLAEHETFVPQSYRLGVEAQVDWYEAYADLDGERVKLQVFSMRSMASGAAFHRAYPCATQQAFLEAHELAFAYFEGVFRVLRYDNLSSAVKKILLCQRYLKIPRIRRLKNPQLRPKPSILTRGGLGCCDWRVLWRYRSCIMTE